MKILVENPNKLANLKKPKVFLFSRIPSLLEIQLNIIPSLLFKALHLHLYECINYRYHQVASGSLFNYLEFYLDDDGGNCL